MPDFDPLDITEDLKDLLREHSPEQRDLHFGCDHQDAPCQVQGEGHIPCRRLGWNPCPQCKEA